MPSLQQKLLLFSGGGAAISVSPASWDFGSTPVGTPVSKEFTIENTGTAALTITAINLPTGYTLTDPALPITILAGATDTFTVEVDADSVDVFAGNISIVSNAATSPTLVAITANVTWPAGLIAEWDASVLASLWQDSGRATPVAANADVIGAWDDRGANAYHILQTTTANKMTYRTNVQNGLPCVRADGLNDYLLKSFGASHAQPLHFFFVMNFIAASGDYIFDGAGAASRVAVFQSAATTMQLFAGTGFNATQNLPTGAELFRYKVNGASSSIHRNGTQLATGAASTNAFTGITLGAANNFSGASETDYFHILAFGDLTAGEITAIESALNAKWAVY